MTASLRESKLRRLVPEPGLLAPLLTGAILRIVVWSQMQASWSDAYDYAINARFIRDGEWDAVSRFMYTFYSVVTAAIDLVVRDALLAGEILSLVSGIALIAIVHRLTLLLGNPVAAACAAWIAALHPRLVEYSTIGYTESFLTALVAAGLLAATSYILARREAAVAAPAAPATPRAWPGRRADLWAVGAFAVAFLVRNDTLFHLPVVLLVLAIADRAAGFAGAARATARRCGLALLVIAIPTAIAWALLGTSPVFRKAGGNIALAAIYDVEALGKWESRLYAVDDEGRLLGTEDEQDRLGLGARARIYAANVLNMSRFYLRRLLFSPLVLAFAAVGLLAVRFHPGALAAEAMLLLAWITPHLFYPLVIVQPQYLLQTLPVLALWSGRGVARSAELLRENAGLSPRAANVAAATGLALVTLPLVAVTALLSWQRLADRGPFAPVAGAWLGRQAREETYMGSDPGLTYYSDNFDQLALPVGVEASDLPRVARANGAALVVVTTRDLDSRRGLAVLLAPDAPEVSGLRRELREEDGRGNVLAIYRVTDESGTSHAARN